MQYISRPEQRTKTNQYFPPGHRCDLTQWQSGCGASTSGGGSSADPCGGERWTTTLPAPRKRIGPELYRQTRASAASMRDGMVMHYKSKRSGHAGPGRGDMDPACVPRRRRGDGRAGGRGDPGAGGTHKSTNTG